jgi:hypothetical protein
MEPMTSSPKLDHHADAEKHDVRQLGSQGRALSGHKTAQAYRAYAKETFDRALAATRKRHAHRVANVDRTSIQNEGRNEIQNETARTKSNQY